ncbi:Imm50 family immunity protein [Streptomyces sp. NPDC101166]|uniref:Imm50 family immunity protein n=1 Tax=Streptomyces sp. NPDC101166 TaxID=3366120 RepID=UPI0037F9332A
MSTPDWLDLLSSPQFLGELYTDAPPAPEQCELFYVHLDERGDSVTIAFATKILPSNPRPEWSEKPYNRLEFYFLFEDLAEFTVNGWSATEAKDFDISGTRREGVTVKAGREPAGISFRASSVGLAGVRVYLAAEGT